MYVLYGKYIINKNSEVTGYILQENDILLYRPIVLEYVHKILSMTNTKYVYFSNNINNKTPKLPLFLVQWQILIFTNDIVLNDIVFDGYIICLGDIELNNSNVNGLLYSINGNITINNSKVTYSKIKPYIYEEEEKIGTEIEVGIEKNDKLEVPKSNRKNLIELDLTDHRLTFQDRSVTFIPIGVDYVHSFQYNEYTTVKINLIHKVSKLINVTVEFYLLETIRNRPPELVLKCKFIYDRDILSKFKKDQFKNFIVYVNHNVIELTVADIHALSKPVPEWKYISYIDGFVLSDLSGNKFQLNKNTAYRLIQWKTGAVNILMGGGNGIKMLTVQSHHRDKRYVDKWQWIPETGKFLKGMTPISANIHSVIDINIAISEHTSILMRIHGIGKVSIMSNTRSALSGIINMNIENNISYIISPENMNNFMKIE